MSAYKDHIICREDTIPPTYTNEEAWIVDNRVKAIATDWEFTGADTSQEYVTLTAYTGKKVRWRLETFQKIAQFAHFISATSSLVIPLDS